MEACDKLQAPLHAMYSALEIGAAQLCDHDPGVVNANVTLLSVHRGNIHEQIVIEPSLSARGNAASENAISTLVVKVHRVNARVVNEIETCVVLGSLANADAENVILTFDAKGDRANDDVGNEIETLVVLGDRAIADAENAIWTSAAKEDLANADAVNETATWPEGVHVIVGAVSQILIWKQGTRAELASVIVTVFENLCHPESGRPISIVQVRVARIPDLPLCHLLGLSAPHYQYLRAVLARVSSKTQNRFRDVARS